MRRCSAASATRAAPGTSPAGVPGVVRPDPPACAVDGCEHGYGTAGCSLDDRGPVAPGDARWGGASPRTSCWRSASPGCRRMSSRASSSAGGEDPADSTDDLTGAEWARPRRRTARRATWSPPPTWHPTGCGRRWWCAAPGSWSWSSTAAARHGCPNGSAELRDRHRIAEIGTDPAGPVGSLLPDLERAGVPVRLLDGRDTVRACGRW